MEHFQGDDMTRGGTRHGAGRPIGTTKENKRIKVGYVVDPDTAAWIKAEAASRRIGQGRVVDELVDKNITHKK